MGAFRRWAVLAVVLVVCVGAAVGARLLATMAWNGVVDYVSPYTDLDVPPAANGRTEITRTVFVIIDGLRLDASRDMGTLNALRSYGADLELTAAQPSLSYPNWTTLVTGAPPSLSGVVTNWHDTPVEAESIFDTAQRADLTTVFCGPKDFEMLYGIEAKTTADFMLPWSKSYRSDVYVDQAIKLAPDNGLVVLHVPDVDEAGHRFGGASPEYSQAVARVDADLNRLVQALGTGDTVFVVTADHGHIDSGGHGGWEPEAITVPCVIAGPGVTIGKGTGSQTSVAPSVALLCGAGSPRMAMAAPLPSAVTTPNSPAVKNAADAAGRMQDAYVANVLEPLGGVLPPADPEAGEDAGDQVERANEARLAAERFGRIPIAGTAAFICVVAIGAVWLASWRALVASAAGALVYYGTFLGLYFGVHGYQWSLSSFNSEDQVGAWMNGRLVEAAFATLIAASFAAAVYPTLRHMPKPPRGRFLAGWLTLGPVTALVILASLGLQVAGFYWAWGVVPVWTLPDLHWGFKFDIDLVQATAVGFAALLTPLVTYLVGRYHPRVRTSISEE